MSYLFSERVFEGSRSLLYRARAPDGTPVIVKRLRELYPSAEKVARFRRELEITRMARGEGVIGVHDSFTVEGTLNLVLEDFGACSLADTFRTRRPPLAQLLEIAGQIAGALAEIHRLGVVHKDVNPSNVVWNESTGVVKLIDFGISQVLGRETPRAQSIESFEGTLPYSSPEQTGRMNRSLDARSDLYSFGATLFSLLVGRPPFAGQDALELVHAHIARRPVAPHEIDASIPERLSRIVMTLLEKRAEDRYQSASGLRHDLELCLADLEGRGEPFALRTRDVDERLIIPERLYGRDAEIAALLEAFESASTGRTRLLLVAGYSGIGKTSLVHEVHRAIAGKRGRFVEGKFDQFKRGIPYASLIEALRQLVRQILGESAESIAAWRARLLEAVGSNGAVLTQVIAEAELLIGEQHKADDLPPQEARNRFQLIMGRSISALASREHPLVVFLDDLQWADMATLDLIDRLTADTGAENVLLIGAYRDNEVDAAHPLMAAVSDIREHGGIVETIQLGPLGEADARELVSDSVLGAPGSEELAAACFRKTGGNPFFLTHFLRALHDDGLLRFDSAAHRWSWEMSEIEKSSITENVVDFLSRRIDRLPERARSALARAACIGGAFDLGTLAATAGLSRQSALGALVDSLDAELIHPLDEGFWYAEHADEDTTSGFTFRFAHDRVRQAARRMLEEREAAAIHLEIGRFLLRRLDAAALEDQLFEVVEHLERGASLIEDHAERERLCELSLSAARRALSSAAFVPAHRYYSQAIEHAGADAWSERYEQTLAIHAEGARAAQLAGDLEAMEQRIAAVTANARTLLDRVKAEEVKISALVSQQRFLDAVTTALPVLRELGVDLPREPSDEEIGAAVGAALGMIGELGADGVVAMREASDPVADAVTRIEIGIMSSAYMAAPKLLALLPASIVRASLERGMTKDSPYGFAVLALVLSALGKIDLASSIGRIATRLLDRWEYRSHHAKTLHVVRAHVSIFVDPLREAIERAKEVYPLGLDTGDLEYAAWSLHGACCNGFYAGIDLPALSETLERNMSIMAQHRQAQALACTHQYAQAVFNLTGKAKDPARLVGPDYDEAEAMKQLAALNFRGAAYVLTAVGTFVRYLFRDLEGAISWADAGGAFADGASSTYHVVWWHQYRALARLGAGGAGAVEAVSASRAFIAALCGFSQANHAHRLHLLDAEIARALGRRGEAMDLYDRAVALARANGFTHEEALANELAGRFHLSRGSTTAARAYLMEASYAYGRWGATAKVAQLEGEFPVLLATRGEPAGSASITTSSSDTTGKQLDLETLFRAANAISSEIHLDALLGKVMDAAIQNAGATRGFLIIDDAVAAAKDAEGTDLVASGTPLDDCPGLPRRVVAYVARTGERLVIADGREDPRSAGDRALAPDRPTSILCSPVVYQGKRSGIVYLENDLTAGAFTAGRIHIQEMLSTQAAISIQNARLYQDLGASLAAQVALTEAHERFVPHQFLETLNRRSIVEVALGDSVRKTMTVLFSDVRDFTSLVEGMTPEESIRWINDYLGHMEPSILESGGFVDSYIGDAILALFEDAGAAVRSALGMLKSLPALNASRAREGAMPIRIGIGVNTGELTLGTIGGETRLKCGVIGDSVNLGSRVESLTKTYRVPLLITDRTLSGLRDRFSIRFADRVVVKGRHTPVSLYEVFDADPPELRDAKLRLSARWDEAVAAYYDRRFAEALSAFTECARALPTDIIATTFATRARQNLSTPPSEAWTGVVELDHK